MVMRLVRFTLNQQASAQAQMLATTLITAIKQQPGCLNAVFFGGGGDGDCGMCVLWETQANADAAYAVINPELQSLLAGKVAAPADIHTFPVIAH